MWHCTVWQAPRSWKQGAMKNRNCCFDGEQRTLWLMSILLGSIRRESPHTKRNKGGPWSQLGSSRARTLVLRAVGLHSPLYEAILVQAQLGTPSTFGEHPQLHPLKKQGRESEHLGSRVGTVVLGLWMAIHRFRNSYRMVCN